MTRDQPAAKINGFSTTRNGHTVTFHGNACVIQARLERAVSPRLQAPSGLSLNAD
jgi:hypothetical protein